MVIKANFLLGNFYHNNKKKNDKHAFMNSLLAVTVSLSPTVDKSFFTSR